MQVHVVRVHTRELGDRTKGNEVEVQKHHKLARVKSARGKES